MAQRRHRLSLPDNRWRARHHRRRLGNHSGFTSRDPAHYQPLHLRRSGPAEFATQRVALPASIRPLLPFDSHQDIVRPASNRIGNFSHPAPAQPPRVHPISRRDPNPRARAREPEPRISARPRTSKGGGERSTVPSERAMGVGRGEQVFCPRDLPISPAPAYPGGGLEKGPS